MVLYTGGGSACFVTNLFETGFTGVDDCSWSSYFVGFKMSFVKHQLVAYQSQGVLDWSKAIQDEQKGSSLFYVSLPYLQRLKESVRLLNREAISMESCVSSSRDRLGFISTYGLSCVQETTWA